MAKGLLVPPGLIESQGACKSDIHQWPAHLATNSLTYGYDSIGQLLTAEGKEVDGTPRLSEQFTYAYDPAGNLNTRRQHLFTNTFNVNSLNQLTTVTRDGKLTVAGTTAGRATKVTVNSLEALLYNDASFARTNMTLSDGNNTFTAVAKDSYGREDTGSQRTHEVDRSGGRVHDACSFRPVRPSVH